MTLSEWVALVGGIIILFLPVWFGWKVIHHR